MWSKMLGSLVTDWAIDRNNQICPIYCHQYQYKLEFIAANRLEKLRPEQNCYAEKYFGHKMFNEIPKTFEGIWSILQDYQLHVMISKQANLSFRSFLSFVCNWLVLGQKTRVACICEFPQRLRAAAAACRNPRFHSGLE